jgi:hypothetical protein
MATIILPSTEANANVTLGSDPYSLPLEIRQQIYDYLLPFEIHAHLTYDRLRLSACIEPCTNGGTGLERMDEDEWRKHTVVCPIWERLLQSTWGPHWRCKEVALGLLLTDHDAVKATDSSLLWVSNECKFIVYAHAERLLTTRDTGVWISST